MKIIKEEGNMTWFECGCMTDICGDKFVIIPHDLNCEVYRYYIQVTKEMNNEMRLYYET